MEDIEMNNYKLTFVVAIAPLLMAATGFAGMSVKAPPPKTDTAIVIPEEAAPALSAPIGPATGEQIKWQVIAGGGGTGSSASYTLGGTVGQTAVGAGSSDSYVLSHGFWQEFGAPPPTGIVSASLSGPGAGAGGTIICGQPVTIDIHFNNNTDTNVLGSTNGFRLYSPEGATWEIPTSQSAGSLEPYYDDTVIVIEFGVNGISDDTVCIFGLRMFSDGLPVGFNEIVMTIETELDCSEEGKTLCIDSTWFPPSNPWLWALPWVGGGVVPKWHGPYCFTIVPCCNHDGIRGDVNYDGSLNVADVTYLVAYLKGLGPAPPCFEEGDVNGNGSINVADVTYLVAYLKGLGPAPPPCGSKASAPAGKVQGDMSLNTSYENGMTLISLESSVGVRGIQIELVGTQTGEPVKLVDDRLELFVNQITDGTTRVLILDLEGEVLIEKGVQALVRLSGEFKIVEAVVSDFENYEIAPAINATAKNTTLPDRFALYQNHPNPFNPTTEISFDLPEAANARLVIYNIMGQRVVTLVDRFTEAGTHSVTWNSTDDQGHRVGSGVYFYRLEAGAFVDTKKMILLK
jgi:hypothetical protein